MWRAVILIALDLAKHLREAANFGFGLSPSREGLVLQTGSAHPVQAIRQRRDAPVRLALDRLRRQGQQQLALLPAAREHVVGELRWRPASFHFAPRHIGRAILARGGRHLWVLQQRALIGREWFTARYRQRQIAVANRLDLSRQSLEAILCLFKRRLSALGIGVAAQHL